MRSNLALVLVVACLGWTGLARGQELPAFPPATEFQPHGPPTAMTGHPGFVHMGDEGYGGYGCSGCQGCHTHEGCLRRLILWCTYHPLPAPAECLCFGCGRCDSCRPPLVHYFALRYPYSGDHAPVHAGPPLVHDYAHD